MAPEPRRRFGNGCMSLRRVRPLARRRVLARPEAVHGDMAVNQGGNTVFMAVLVQMRKDGFFN